MRRTFMVCAVSLVAGLCTLATPRLHAQTGATKRSSDATADALVGRWHGIRVTKRGEVHNEDFFDFEFIRDDSGLLFTDNGRFVMIGEPVRVAVSPDGAARAEWQQMMQVSRAISVRVIENGAALDAHITAAGFMNDADDLQLRLTRSSPGTDAYLAPRMADGRRVTSYRYSVPEQIAGSWPVAAPESVAVERAPLIRLANDILGEGDRVSDRRTDGVLVLRHGMTMPPRDMAKIGQLMLDGGIWEGKRLVSKDWVVLSTTRQTRPHDYPYGYLWHLSSAAFPWRGQPSYFGPVDRYDAFTAIGQGGQIIMVLPEADMVVVIVSSNWMPGFVNGFPTDLVNRYIIPAIRPAKR